MRAATLWVIAQLLTSCLVSFEDYPVSGTSDASGQGGSTPDASAGTGGTTGGIGGAAGSGGSAAGAGSGGVGAVAGGGGVAMDGAAGNPNCVDGHSKFADDFNDNAISPAWTVVETLGMDAIEGSGKLLVLFPTSTPVNAFGGLETVPYFDLHSCGIFVQITQRPDHPNATMVFGMKQSGQFFEYDIEAGFLIARTYVSGAYNVVAEATYNDSIHAWLKLREDNGMFFWETSPDSKNWSVFALGNGFDVSLATIYLGAGTTTVPVPNSLPAGFDNLDIPL